MLLGVPHPGVEDEPEGQRAPTHNGLVLGWLTVLQSIRTLIPSTNQCECAVVIQDGSPHGPKSFVLWNPPLLAGGSGGGSAASRVEDRSRQQAAARRQRQEANQDRGSGEAGGGGGAGWLSGGRGGRGGGAFVFLFGLCQQMQRQTASACPHHRPAPSAGQPD